MSNGEWRMTNVEGRMLMMICLLIRHSTIAPQTVSKCIGSTRR